MKLNGRYPWCPDCEGRGQLPCAVCRGGHADCERCEGTDSEVCTTCEQMHTLFKGEPMTNILAMARELVTLRAEKAKPRLITVSSGGTYLSSEDFNAALRQLELQRDEARAKAARLADCGQAGACQLSPGCVRHFIERNAELVKERDRAKWACNAYYHDLARIGSLCEQTADEYPLKAVERTVRQFAEVIKQRDEARIALRHLFLSRDASWMGGHDWNEAVDAALAVFEKR